jgi:hypothetical protein
MDQLTIFDVINQFDESRVRWENVMNEFEIGYVKAYIPKDALSPLEQNYSNGLSGAERERFHKLWSNYTSGIWGYILSTEKIPHSTSWHKACDRLQEYRDAGKPCPMEVVRWFNKHNDFYPENVIEYL